MKPNYFLLSKTWMRQRPYDFSLVLGSLSHDMRLFQEHPSQSPIGYGFKKQPDDLFSPW